MVQGNTMESTKTTENKADDLINAGCATTTPTISSIISSIKPTEGSSNETHQVVNTGASDQGILSPIDTNNSKESKTSRPKRKKKNSRKAKNKDSSSPSNTRDDIITPHNPEAENSSEMRKDSDIEKQNHLDTEILPTRPSVPAIQEHETDQIISQKQTSISKNDAINLKASETKTSVPENLPTISIDVKNKNNVASNPISLSSKISISSDGIQQDTFPSPAESTEDSSTGQSTTADKDQESLEDIQISNEPSGFETSDVGISKIDEKVSRTGDSDCEAPTINCISEIARFDIIKDETTPMLPSKEGSIPSTPLWGDSRSLVSEETVTQSTGDSTTQTKFSEVAVPSEVPSTSSVESGLLSISTIATNSDDRIVTDIDQTPSTINLEGKSQIIHKSISQEPEISSLTSIGKTGLPSHQEQQKAIQTSGDDIKTRINSTSGSHVITDAVSEVLDINSGTNRESSSKVTDTDSSTNFIICEAQNISNDTVITKELMASEILDDSMDVENELQPETSILKTSPMIDIGTTDNEIDVIEEFTVEEINTSIASSTVFKEPIDEADFTKANDKENRDKSDPSDILSKINLTEDKTTESEQIEVTELIKDDSINKVSLENHPNSNQAVKTESSECLCAHIETSQEQNKELQPEAATHLSDIEEKFAVPKDSVESKSGEGHRFEIWKNSLESTANKALSVIETKIPQVTDLLEGFRHSESETQNSDIVNTIASSSKNDELYGQRPDQSLMMEENSLGENSSNNTYSDLIISRGKLDSTVNLDEVKSNCEALAISSTNEVLESSASQAEIADKIKLKFKPTVGEKALAPELVTISKETLDMLYKRLDSMQLEIERLSSALKRHNEITQASLEDTSSRNLKDDYVNAESSQQKPKISSTEEIVRVEPLKPISNSRYFTKSSCLRRLISIFGYKTTTKPETVLATRSVSENLLQPSFQGPKGKGKEIVPQPNIVTITRKYKVIGKVRAKHDLS